jgi:hypothetical protein
LHESINEHPIVLGHFSNSLRSKLAKCVKRARLAEARNHFLNPCQRIGRKPVGRVSGFEFQHEGVPAAMQAYIEREIISDAQQGIQQMAWLPKIQRRCQRPDPFDLIGSKKCIGAATEEFLRRCPSQAQDVTSHLQYLETIGVEHQHCAVR